MKILYGIQATGNGHITRARAIGKALSNTSAKVDYLFSGRQRNQFFDMDDFGNWQCYPGMTFVYKNGKVQPFHTLYRNKILKFWQDIKHLDPTDYDVVITDFEPIAAWAAKRAGKTSIGIGHQYAFSSAIPLRGDSVATRMLMRHFAPARVSLGLHWHHFGQPILPPIVDTLENHCTTIDPKKIVVYLGFESSEKVIQLLQPFKDYEFYYYGEFAQAEDRDHIHLRPLSRKGFQQDLMTCNGVLCNAGFELASEALQLGKKLLVKPLIGQMEQLSNAAALEQLQLGMTMNQLDSNTIRQWLDSWEAKQVIYPNVAEAIAHWILEGDWLEPQRLAKKLWKQVSSPDISDFNNFQRSSKVA